jgi:hypothetical protein
MNTSDIQSRILMGRIINHLFGGWYLGSDVMYTRFGSVAVRQLLNSVCLHLFSLPRKYLVNKYPMQERICQ